MGAKEKIDKQRRDAADAPEKKRRGEDRLIKKKIAKERKGKK